MIKQINDVTIEVYLSENMETIIRKIESVFDYNNNDIRAIPRQFCLIPEEKGYVNLQKPILGEYKDKKEILLSPKGMNIKVSDLVNQMGKDDNLYMFFDLIVIHEFMHVYQDRVEQKTMKRGDKNLEEDANAKALKVFAEAYPADAKIKKEIFDYFISISENKLPDGITTDCLLQ